MIHYKETKHGFEFGDLKVTRLFADAKKGWVVIGIETSRHKMDENNEIQVYVTRTGKVRVSSEKGEWLLKKNSEVKE